MGVWGRVCEDSSIFDEEPVSDKEANVTCRMMGYDGGKRFVMYLYSLNHGIFLSDDEMCQWEMVCHVSFLM